MTGRGGVWSVAEVQARCGGPVVAVGGLARHRRPLTRPRPAGGSWGRLGAVLVLVAVVVPGPVAGTPGDTPRNPQAVDNRPAR